MRNVVTFLGTRPEIVKLSPVLPLLDQQAAHTIVHSGQHYSYEMDAQFFDELTALSEKELKRSGEFVLPGMVKLVVQKRKARMGRNPATGEAIKIPAKTVVKARIAKQLKDAVLPRK